MPRPLENRNVVLGVSGSIACHKAADLASKLTQEGALVDIVMTPSAANFVTPLAFRSITHRPVATDLFGPQSDAAIEHVATAQRADVIVVAPATANTIAKLALGLSDDALSATVLASRAPVVVCPAMDRHMYESPATHQNVETLESRGVTVVGPAEGHLASGLTGPGRMLEVPEIIGHIKLVLGRDGDLAGRKIVVSAGGTREAIDPVRFISNRSSGKMGYAVAEAARDRGATTVVVAGPNGLPDPVGVAVVNVVTAREMLDAMVRESQDSDAVIMSAAVADWRPTTVADQKLKKDAAESWSVELTRTEDILAELRDQRLIKVGFAAESEDLEANARAKLTSKGLDLIAANDVTAEGSGFDSDTNRVVLLDRDGGVDDLGLLSKYDVGWRILDRVSALMG